MNVAAGGNEASSYSACDGILALAENPAQYDCLLDDPGLLDPALNQILRWSSTNCARTSSSASPTSRCTCARGDPFGR
jgi:cytochrome P450